LLAGAVGEGSVWEATFAVALTVTPIVGLVAIGSGRLTAARIATAAFAVTDTMVRIALTGGGNGSRSVSLLLVAMFLASFAPFLLLVVSPERRERRGQPLFGRTGWGVMGGFFVIALVDGIWSDGVWRDPGPYGALILLVGSVVALAAGARRSEVMLGVVAGSFPLLLGWVAGPILLTLALANQLPDRYGTTVIETWGPIGAIATSLPLERGLGALLWTTAAVVAAVGLARAERASA
jgi:hypothetical protein